MLLRATLLLGISQGAAAQVAFDPVFADHAVLQRDTPLLIRGTAKRGERVTVTIGDRSAAAVTDATGRWRVRLDPMPAGGPYRLSATAGDTPPVALDDIMLGDVFLCGGQSNMSYLTKYATDASNQLRTPRDPAIRYATVPFREPFTSQQSLDQTLRWQIAAPDTLGDSSAVCYYMARDLQKAEGVTIGFIRSSYGGTRIQSWLSGAALSRLAPYDAQRAALLTYARDPMRGEAAWQAYTEGWWRGAVADPGRAGRWMHADFDDGDWDWARLAGQSSTPTDRSGGFSGSLWYRHRLTLDARRASRTVTLDLGKIDADVTLWINGRQIAARSQGPARPFTIPGNTLRAGSNVIAVRLLDHGAPWTTRVCADGCGLVERDGVRTVLMPEWRYRVGARLHDLPLASRPPWTAQRGLGTLHNGMIAPLGAYALKGVVWYQGESNVFDPVEYRRLLPVLLSDWRQSLGDTGLPFVLVQLSSFGPVKTQPGTSDWAALREVQRQVSLADARTALVISYDVGDRTDIHPAQKKVVGQRVALAMRSLAYGEPATGGGPRPRGATRTGNDIVIAFNATGGRLQTYSADRAIGFELCDQAYRCRYVDAQVRGDRVVLTGAVPTDRFVRYAWANSPFVNLFGGDDIPAVPFELGID